MPDITPSGPLSIAVDGLRTLIANVPFFQTWTGSANAATALNRIFTGEAGYPIASFSIAGGVLAVTTRDQHTMLPGDAVTIEGAATGPQSGLNIDASYTIAAVTANGFTAAIAAANSAVQYPDEAFVISAVRPIAVIADAEDGLHSTRDGTGGFGVYGGSIEILLEADTSAPYKNDRRNALYEARNSFGQFLQGLTETQDTADLMVLNRIEPISAPTFTSAPEQDDNAARFERWRALLRVSWGLDA